VASPGVGEEHALEAFLGVGMVGFFAIGTGAGGGMLLELAGAFAPPDPGLGRTREGSAASLSTPVPSVCSNLSLPSGRINAILHSIHSEKEGL